MNGCVHRTKDGRCLFLSDDETTEFCVEGPCKEILRQGEQNMSEYGSGITMMEGFALDRERIRHAWDGELVCGEDDRGFFLYEPADEGDCLAFIIKAFDNAVFQCRQALAAGRALEHMLQERIPDYPYGESFEEYQKARVAEEERDLKRADYPFDDDPDDWTARIGDE
jgi:hypothetical protein